MDNIELGHKTLEFLFKTLRYFFKSGDIVIAGSFYYKKIGCPVHTDYKDIDLVVNEKRDDIFHSILDLIEYKHYPISSFRNRFDDGVLIGAFRIDGYAGVDLLRNDFSDLLPQIEIIPGVWSHCLSDGVLYKTYENLEVKTKNPKYSEIKNFFHDRSLLAI